MKRFALSLASILLVFTQSNFPTYSQEFSQSWSDLSASTATAYCLAKHTGVKPGPDGYSADGFEVSTSFAVGSVRRNFVLNRPPQTLGMDDAGKDQTCEQACAQLGNFYQPAYTGSSLKYRPQGTIAVSSGIGDHAQLAMRDHDFYTQGRVISGFLTRPQNYQNEDVAQADHCCCQVVPAPTSESAN
jgi:hypothetical protein